MARGIRFALFISLSLSTYHFPLTTPLAFAQAGPVPSEDDFLLNVLWDRFQALPQEKDVKLGLALGGGGARGLAHIGVLKVFEEEGIPLQAIAGTSVGALIGALYAAGISTSQMEQMSQEIGWSTLTNYSRLSLVRLLLTEQQLSSRKMELYLEKNINNRRFDELKLPFTCSATDLQTGERVIFREGPVALAARASATIPGLFEPVIFRHRYLVDGGLVGNIPTDLAADMGANIIIASDVTSDLSSYEPKNIFSTLNQAIYIQSETMSKDELAKADIVIRPQLGDVSAVDLSRQAECIDNGILATRRAVPAIKMLLVDRSFERVMALRHHDKS